MSGGSYNYLDSVADVHGVGGLLQRQNDLRNMAHRLDGVCPEAAAETRLFVEGGTAEQQVASVFHGIDAHLERLRPLWHAVEWCDSNDWGEDDLARAVAEYRALPPIPPAPLVASWPVHAPMPGDSLVFFTDWGPDRAGSARDLGDIEQVHLEELGLLNLRFLEVRLDEALGAVRSAIVERRALEGWA